MFASAQPGKSLSVTQELLVSGKSLLFPNEFFRILPTR
jgi:hypothetical protein